MQTLAFVGGLSTWELLIILVIALLLFGKRLPEVGKSIGKGIVEFKKGLKGIEEEVDDAASRPAAHRAAPATLPEGQDTRRVSRADSPDVPTQVTPPGHA
jgi:sec-independent protein translocase protein TatA